MKKKKINEEELFYCDWAISENHSIKNEMREAGKKFDYELVDWWGCMNEIKKDTECKDQSA